MVTGQKTVRQIGVGGSAEWEGKKKEKKSLLLKLRRLGIVTVVVAHWAKWAPALFAVLLLT